MQNIGTPSKTDMTGIGLHDLKNVYWNLYPAQLVEESLKRSEGNLTELGSIVVATGKYTGRSPNDKFVVQYGTADDADVWWGKVNRPINPEQF